MDNTVDALYRKYLRELIAQQNDVNKGEMNSRYYISGLLILRYLERISDHACYIGDSIDYILTGKSSPRR
jgi:phosphate transport system protein